jgi:hypothetical protein
MTRYPVLLFAAFAWAQANAQVTIIQGKIDSSIIKIGCKVTQARPQ